MWWCWQEAVELALRVDVSLAKENADKPPSDELRKRLWLLIARHLIEVRPLVDCTGTKRMRDRNDTVGLPVCRWSRLR